MKFKLVIIQFIFTICPLLLFAQNNNEITPKGTLLIMGGDSTNEYFIKEFAGLVGGLDRKIVIIPTAMEDKYLATEWDINFLKKPFVDIGFKNIQIVHTREVKVANSDSLNEILLASDGVWITGGRQWRLSKTYNNTKIQSSLKTLFNKGKVIAGTSAGASIMGDVLVRGDSNNSTVMLGDFQKGFGLIPNFAIDQHHIARNRQFDMFEIKNLKPDILGIGIDENTGVILNENKFRVIGKSYVTIYDGTRWSEERDIIYQLDKNDMQFYTLSNGYEYDIVKRKYIDNSDRESSFYNRSMIKNIEGTYQQVEGLQIGQDLNVTVTFENNQLHFNQSWNDAKYTVNYHYLNTYYRPNTISSYHFEKDRNGNIVAFTFFQFQLGVTKWIKK